MNLRSISIQSTSSVTETFSRLCSEKNGENSVIVAGDIASFKADIAFSASRAMLYEHLNMPSRVDFFAHEKQEKITAVYDFISGVILKDKLSGVLKSNAEANRLLFN